MLLTVLRSLRKRPAMMAVVHLTTSRMFALAANLLCGWLTAVCLGPEGRGELAALIVGSLVLSNVSTLGLHASLIYNIKLDCANGCRYFGGALVLTSLAGLTVAAAAYALVPIYLRQYTADTIYVARILLASVPLGAVAPLLTGVLEVAGLFAIASRMIYLQSFGTLIFLGLLAAFDVLTPHTALAAYVLPTCLSFCYLCVHAWRTLACQITLASPFPGRLLSYGLRFYGVDLLATLSGYLDQFVIVLVLQPAAAGTYAVAVSLSRVLYVVQGAVSTVLFPTVAAEDTSNVVDRVTRVTRVTTGLNLIAALGCASVAPFALPLLYGAHFDGAIAPFLILLIESIVTSTARSLAQAFSGSGHPGTVTIAEVVGVIGSLVSVLLLVPHLGVLGAACGSLMGGSLRLACVLTCFPTVLKIRLPRLLIKRADIAWAAGL
ncbi:lipopolysaccharide biosynthesis protein [Paracraurococcus lichenis]|uniref:Oligosaccharide flippase family protein n=1 Tax=Paracraurococcus lichenis TaxID=3064888 RepID=A0ABT9EAX7_9PROT|nr:oligosaccharide flippase family protein [Paracraurococcus sp. LOR1-02]MDO9713366.1 oligosaccharide flippase family protein [Paracraurococcus sp. LOR1-02]